MIKVTFQTKSKSLPQSVCELNRTEVVGQQLPLTGDLSKQLIVNKHDWVNILFQDFMEATKMESGEVHLTLSPNSSEDSKVGIDAIVHFRSLEEYKERITRTLLFVSPYGPVDVWVNFTDGKMEGTISFHQLRKTPITETNYNNIYILTSYLPTQFNESSYFYLDAKNGEIEGVTCPLAFSN